MLADSRALQRARSQTDGPQNRVWLRCGTRWNDVGSEHILAFAMRRRWHVSIHLIFTKVSVCGVVQRLCFIHDSHGGVRARRGGIGLCKTKLTKNSWWTFVDRACCASPGFMTTLVWKLASSQPDIGPLLTRHRQATYCTSLSGSSASASLPLPPHPLTQTNKFHHNNNRHDECNYG